MSESLMQLQKRIGHSFREVALLREAMTHKSYATELNLDYDNQRLEFFGDAVVQLVLTKHLFYRYPELQEGDLTKLRSALVNQDSLAVFARSIELGQYIQLGRGEIDANGGDRDSTLSDAFEALCGALYMDTGYETAEHFILTLLEENVKDPLRLLTSLNPKGALQEYTQASLNKTPHYKILSVSGPAHEPSYEVAVFLGEELLATGNAQNRKNAEQAAAEKALQVLKEHKEDSAK